MTSTTIKFNDEQIKTIIEALEMSQAFAVYGDGADEHKEKIKKLIDTILLATLPY